MPNPGQCTCDASVDNAERGRFLCLTATVALEPLQPSSEIRWRAAEDQNWSPHTCACTKEINQCSRGLFPLKCHLEREREGEERVGRLQAKNTAPL